MSSQVKSHPGRISAMVAATVIILSLFTAVASAQEQSPKWEFYGGYSFFDPGADVHGQLPGGLFPLSSRLEVNPRGAGASVTYDFNRWFGLTLDGSDQWGSGETTIAKTIDDAGLGNISFGPKVTFRRKHFSPFLEGLVGVHRLTPEAFHDVDRLGFLLGGGLDINLSRHIALRLLRADFVMSSYRFGPAATTPTTDIRGARLQTGLVFLLGGGAPPDLPSASCAVEPAQVFAGEPVNATAHGSNFNPKRTMRYDWSGTGFKMSGTDTTANIDTTGLQPGSYGVTAHLSDGSKLGVASCSATFIVKAPRPPTISCVADPNNVPSGGGNSTISSNATSPDGRQLTYSYTTSAGTISGNNASANLDSRGVQPGSITVTCNVSDDRNPALTASSTTVVTVQPPPPVPDVSAIEKRLALHSIYFATAKPTAENPDGGLLASQETTLTNLATDFKSYLETKPDAVLTLEGHADPRGSVAYNQALSERRVERINRYLVQLGIPAANLRTKAFGEQENLTDAQVRDAVERNPELSAEQRQKVLDNMTTIILASNRRVDITLSTAGQQTQESVQQYPFNAADSLTLLDTSGSKKKPARPTTKSRKK